MNKAILIGRLTRDPELRTTSNTGVSVCTFTVAVDRRRSRDREKEADFIPVVVWREQAENCAKYLRKGSQVGVCGSIQVRNYDAQDGTKRYVTEVVADEVQFLTSRSESGEGGSGAYAPPVPRAQAPAQRASVPAMDMEEIDEELPF